MSGEIICEGDKTSHGGTVVEGSRFSDIAGKAIARVGDKVYCPQCKGTFPIVSGDITLVIDGAAVARHGDKTSCGASLIAGQLNTSDRAGSASAAGSSVKKNTDTAGSFTSGGAQKNDAHAETVFEDYFQLIDEDTGLPLANHEYAITRASGSIEYGTTGSTGNTHMLSETAIAESITIHI